MNRTIIGLDLAQDYSQISYYNERNGEIETASIQKGKDNYLIPTPKDLFRTALEIKELGIITLSNFLKTCISFIRPVPQPQGICIMVTMREITKQWLGAVREACEMVGIPEDQIFMQTYKESFECYVLNQKKEIWNQSSVLFEYAGDTITSQILKIDRSTKPAIVTIADSYQSKVGEQGVLTREQWDKKRDLSFLEQIREVFANEKISSCFLVGEQFNKNWAEESIAVLCKKRHVFLGQNLYTKGACYGMCRRLKVGKDMTDFLYRSEDLVEVNLSMQLEIRGKETKYLLIAAGNNWYDSYHSFEVIVDQEKKLRFMVKSMMGGDVDTYTITLTGLPERPGRTTRVHITAEYQDATHCRITVKDLGFGEIFPSTNLSWTSILEVG